ncbi:YqcI/YcgG family protein [Bacillus wiedmannii]|uniref:YqcI/YcgG family protein n=1 Tax=Bacillus thuringiensis TaxID=1428 RepID=A0A1C4ERZ4_BACTU|nr:MULTISPECIES: YqcI/YcgG family protein [Bacillus]MCC2326883.1 YqcI/YcgG family protein [Bacillus wiedmannii]MED3025565.1 YqcI/YcgG family protein [Bacillus wiedmannii]OTX98777.1 hypothetical protein BK729_12510 [Bacillus thuringiensis serovar wratislaviensis]OUB58214.1 hypothetical protein BK743_14980 [Bacillus thuringiensis serovar sylvestriensis]PEJ61332.1 YqcI/YcgG family protein [Bacillus wiedmannii]
MPTTKMYLYDQKRIIEEQNKGILDEWKTVSFNNFHDSILDQSKPFPCYFAVDSEKHGWSRYIFSESAYDENELFKLRDGIYEYIKTYQQIAKRTTLVIFFKPSNKQLLAEEYKKQFWNVLQFLMRNDPEPWNAEIPIDPYNAKWEFCFGGEPIFVVCRAPIYSERKSRHTGTGLEITLQPRGTLDDITGDTKQGKQVRKVIRKRLLAYDDIPMHPDIGDYGIKETFEWKQYMLPETNEESVMRCPITGLKKND